MATFDEFITSIRNEFGEQDAGKKFEVFCKWFLENDPEWSKTIDKVWLWDDYPNKWQRQDLGTDLVFRDNEGLIWAVQAKCYGEHRSTTKGDMNSFLADTGRKEVDRRLWLQTTNKIEAKAEKTLTGQDKPVTIFKLNDFRDAPLEYPSSYADLYQAKVKAKPTPDTHQIKAIEDVTTGLKTCDRGQMIMACGTGKTFTTLWIKEALEAHNTLVLLPSLSLLSQTMREWAWAGNTDFEILNVCSDKSVGKKTEDMEPSDAPFPVTSEVEEIAKFLRKPEPKVIFCTYQSSELIAQAQLDEAVPTFDLAVADEAHRCAGKADAGFATILDGEKIRASKRLFTTATPRYFGQAIKDEANARDLAVVGMDNEPVFGPVIHQLTFGEAIQRELLTDYQVVIVGVDEPMVKMWIDDQEIVAINPDEYTDARTLAAKIGLIKAIKDYDLKRVISFHSRVKGAKDFSEELVDVVDLIDPIQRPEGKFLADYVSGGMKAGDRKDKIERLKVLDGYDRGILTNARCLAEGVDVPSLDGVAFIDPRASQVDIIQAVGRAIRKVRGADVQIKGTIVIPVFIEAGDDPEASIEASKFKPVWDVLKALRAHDEVLSSTLDEYRTNMAKNASQSRERISDKIIFDIPATVDVEFSSALRTVLVEASTASWEFWFGLLEQFKEVEGHCNVTQKGQYQGFKLGSWVSNQRQCRYRLSRKNRQRLDAIGFDWDPNVTAWYQGLSELKEFNRENGHCKVNIRYLQNGFRLGQWVAVQRVNKAALSNEIIKKLDDINFVWIVSSENFDAGMQSLEAFKAREGHCLVPTTHTENDFGLGQWVRRQRSLKECMPQDCFRKLQALDFIWDARKEQWDQAFNRLQQFKDEKNHCNLPHDFYTQDGFKLGAWATKQRSNHSTLSNSRKEKLNAIGFVWDLSKEAWETGFNKLVQFKESEGHCRVPQNSNFNDFNLGTWVASQRSKQDTLSVDQILKLKGIRFSWDPVFEKWNEAYDELQHFFQVNGHTKIPASTGKLGVWITLQRKKFLTGHMAESEQLLLEQFPDWNWNPVKEAWQSKYQSILLFLNANPNISANELNNDTLLRWLQKQRVKKTQLSGKQQRLLEGLRGFSWVPHDDAWNSAFGELQRYLKENGSYPTQSYITNNGLRLGLWLNRTRANKHLSTERKQLLQSLPGWSFDKRGQDWQAAFNKYANYVTNTGSAKIPAKHLVDEAFDLGRWVTHMKKTFDKLDLEKKALLESFPGWSINYREDRWNDGYLKLLEFVSSEGHACPLQTFKTADGFNLGGWVKRQRNDRVLIDERVQKLEQLQGWSWNPDQDNWDRAFVLLKGYEAEYGDCAPKDKFKYNGFRLSSWIYYQKKHHIKGSLQNDRIIRLSSLRTWKW